MGGQNEEVIQPSGKKTGLTINKVGEQELRIHRAGSEIHFHDDKEKLKASIPVSDYWSAWRKIRDSNDTWNYTDHKNNTEVSIHFSAVTNDFVVSLYKVKPYGATFDALDKLANA